MADPGIDRRTEEFYTALLDEIDGYTRAAELTQRTVRSLGSAQQQEKIRVEIRKRAQELQEQLVGRQDFGPSSHLRR